MYVCRPKKSLHKTLCLVLFFFFSIDSIMDVYYGSYDKYERF